MLCGMSVPHDPLAHFRAECYQSFGLRRAALSDLLDAVLSGDRVTSLVRLSLEPRFRRGWASVFDALADGRIDRAAVRRLLGHSLPEPEAGQRLLWVIDGSSWPRPAAKTSPGRTHCRVVHAGQPQSGIVPGWEYQWLAAIPEAQGSWVLPLEVRRRGPNAGTPTDLAITQLKAVLRTRPAGAPRPVVLLDSQYDIPQLIAAKLPVDVLARLAANRRFFRAPPAYAGIGRPRKHGAVFRCAEPATQHDPDQLQRWDDADHGQVSIACWRDLHPQAHPDLSVTVVRITVDRLPRRTTPPAPWWLVWQGDALPTDLAVLWHWYRRRFAIEHGFRFLKQDLGWTVPRLRTPHQADRWSWLLVLVVWQLWLARSRISEARLPWERATTASDRSPGRVRRGMDRLLATLPVLAPAPRPRGKSPGRATADRPGPRIRHPVHKRAPPSAAATA